MFRICMNRCVVQVFTIKYNAVKVDFKESHLSYPY